MNTFKYLDYRSAIADFLQESKDNGVSINISKLAEKIRVQKTYVSRVLRKQAHFSSDQIYACAAALGFGQEETDYLILLMEYDRTALKDRKRFLLDRIHDKQAEKRNIQDHVSATMHSTTIEQNYVEYYLDPYMPVVYMHLLIPEYARDPQKIRTIIPVPPEQLKSILGTLERLKLVERGADQRSYRVTVNNLHLPKQSPLSFPAEQLTRMMAFEHMRKIPKDKRFYYSATFTADESTRAYLHDEFLQYLQRANARINPAPSEAAYHIAFELFPWKAD
jgi:uncharacterized protein (TIGR02147 family)